MTDQRRPAAPELTCDEVRDLAASFVLGALSEVEMDAVRGHLTTCVQPHPEVAELAGVLPVLDASVRQVEPPPALKDRIMSAAAADLDARRRAAADAAEAAPPAMSITAPAADAVPARPVALPERAAVMPAPRTSRLSWALGIAAVLAIALLGGWNLLLQSQLNDAQRYQQQVAAVVDAATQPGSLTAVMTSTEGGGPSGFAAVTPDGVARIAMRDLAPTAGQEVYEGWVIAGDADPVALGGFKVGSDGFGYLEAEGLPTDSGFVLALTREPGPGATAPSSAPVSTGTATTVG
jgi:hypothetical protein